MIEVENLSRRFGNRELVKDLSFSGIQGNFTLVRNRDLPYLFMVSGDVVKKLKQMIEVFLNRRSG